MRGGIWFMGNGVGKGNETGGHHSLLEREHHMFPVDNPLEG